MYKTIDLYRVASGRRCWSGKNGLYAFIMLLRRTWLLDADDGLTFRQDACSWLFLWRDAYDFHPTGFGSCEAKRDRRLKGTFPKEYRASPSYLSARPLEWRSWLLSHPFTFTVKGDSPNSRCLFTSAASTFDNYDLSAAVVF